MKIPRESPLSGRYSERTIRKTRACFARFRGSLPQSIDSPGIRVSTESRSLEIPCAPRRRGIQGQFRYRYAPRGYPPALRALSACGRHAAPPHIPDALRAIKSFESVCSGFHTILPQNLIEPKPPAPGGLPGLAVLFPIRLRPAEGWDFTCAAGGRGACR